ncbi:MAG: hypothetical protein COB22_02315 [Cycloclasticus sp.]|nr:MAG: hypothetical protein COB22_02315 [Cycloclasticus sp.]
MKKKPRKIAYIVSAGNGLESFVFREIDYLVEQGIDLSIYATKYKAGDVYTPKEFWVTYYISASKITVLPIILSGLITQFRLIPKALKTKSFVDLVLAIYFSFYMKKNKIEQIHCHFGDHKLFVGYYCQKILGLPLSVTIHSHELHVNPNERMFQIALQSCNRVFVISQLAKDIITNRYGVSKKKVLLSKLWVDDSEWRPEKPCRVLTVARFQPQKGFSDLLEAAKILRDIDIEFVIVGYGPLDVKKIATEKGVGSKVVFFDKLDCKQLQFLYQNVDIYCLPSITHSEQGREGIPVVLMEAMASGLPVVATNCGAVHEIVTTKIVEESSPSQLASAILEYANSKELRIKDGEKNRDKVKHDFSTINIERFLSNLLTK